MSSYACAAEASRGLVAVIVFGGQGVLIGDGNHFVNGAYHRKTC